MLPLDRRDFLSAAAASLPLAHLIPADQAPASPNRIVRVHAPQNLEMDFAALSGFVTPTESFYVRNHFAAPKIDLGAWRLKIEGAVARSLSLGLDDIQKLGTQTRSLTMECAGNGRVFLTPPARGVNWQLGAVGNAEWTGIPVKALLELAGVKKKAVEVVFESADSGVVADPASPGAIPFARSLALEKANQPEVMLAWGMNGKDLLPEHGAPLRAVVGGWYGMASVKWLSRIIVADKPFNGFWQTLDYTWFERAHGLASLTPVTTMPVKSQIARPSLGTVVPVGKSMVISGAAWAGEADVTKVEISTDGGKNWAEAKLVGERTPFCWRLWEYDWKPGMPGKAVLMSRATDSKGRTQPMERNPDYRTYMISHVLPVEVNVK
jgi:DMSO/TMAO reductase YedYZ molybdopterin-dependent catalytic subunit